MTDYLDSYDRDEPDEEYWDRQAALQARWAREDRERERAAEQARREPLYRAADAAAEGVRSGSGSDPTLQRLRRHVIDLACEEPPVQIYWMPPGSRVARVIGSQGAAAIRHIQTRCMIIGPIVDAESYAAALHEKGHHSAPGGFGSDTLMSEVSAWQYARSVALVWDARMQGAMVRSIDTYTATAKGTDAKQVLGVLAIDDLCSARAFAEERMRRVRLEIERDAAAKGRQ